MKVITILFAFILVVSANNKFKNCSLIINKKIYKVCYSYKNKGALFVSYTLNGKLVNSLNIKKRQNFYTEKIIPIKYRNSPKDYIKSGFDRGHLLSDASADYSKKSLHKAYSMANIIPQYPSINRYTWIKTEKLERKLAVKFGNIKVVIGVIYGNNPKKIGKDKIAVPIAYYKKLYNDKGFKQCYYYKNKINIITKKDKLKNHLVNCDSLHIMAF